jgi:hypothetical protein
VIKHSSVSGAKIHKAASRWRVRVFKGGSLDPSSDQTVWAVNQWSAVRFVTKVPHVVRKYGALEGDTLRYTVPAVNRREREQLQVVVDPISGELEPVILPVVRYHG